MRAYVINTLFVIDENEDFMGCDNTFKHEAIRQGRVFTTSQFQEEFNNDRINSNTCFVKFFQ